MGRKTYQTTRSPGNFLDPFKKASGLLCCGFLYRKNRGENVVGLGSEKIRKAPSRSTILWSLKPMEELDTDFGGNSYEPIILLCLLPLLCSLFLFPCEEKVMTIYGARPLAAGPFADSDINNRWPSGPSRPRPNNPCEILILTPQIIYGTFSVLILIFRVCLTAIRSGNGLRN